MTWDDFEHHERHSVGSVGALRCRRPLFPHAIPTHSRGFSYHQSAAYLDEVLSVVRNVLPQLLRKRHLVHVPITSQRIAPGRRTRTFMRQHAGPGQKTSRSEQLKRRPSITERQAFHRQARASNHKKTRRSKQQQQQLLKNIFAI